MTKLKLSVSAAALALIMSGAVSTARAADVVADPGCTLSGSVTIGYMYDWQNSEFDESEDGSIDGKDIDWNTPFGEGAGLVTCGGFNVQADFAYYDHTTDDLDDTGSPFGDKDLDQTNSHFGGALFYRDPASYAVGVQASWISQDIVSKDDDIFRVGLFGEIYLDDTFTLGGSAAYYNRDGFSEDSGFSGKDDDGFELAAWGKFYATPDFALTLRGDVLLADAEFSAEDADFTGFAITGDAEYLVWDQGLSIFGGARYAEREVDFDDVDFETTVDDFQVFAGLKFYFGHDGTLLERQRTGTIDNTSVFNEKLPNFLISDLLGIEGAD